jgi:ring-1,2-phenylacetyl-CoA epoxidase subunit PaaC
MNTEALKDLLFRLADDDLVIGHRNSEWTGFGPALEEDIAFASMAQDCVGHAQSYYTLIHELGEADPDRLAFHRSEKDFRSCHLVEQPIGDYAFSLIRHFLYDLAKQVRLEALVQSSYAPLAQLADRIRREHKYARLHAITWVKQLASGSDEARLRLQSALNEAYPMAFGLFEATDHTETLAAEGIQPTEQELQARWQQLLEQVLAGTGLTLPTGFDPAPFLGGRKGYHSEHLGPMLAEMTEVYALDPEAVW